MPLALAHPTVAQIEDTLKPLRRLTGIFSLDCPVPKMRWQLFWFVSKALASATVLGLLNFFTLYIKIRDHYNEINLSIKLTDAIQMVYDYSQYIVDLFFVFKYGREIYAEYYKQYANIDQYLTTDYSAIKKRLNKSIICFAVIWVVTSVCDYTTWALSYGVLLPTLYSTSYIFLLLKMFNTLDLMSHVMHVEFRLKCIVDQLRNSYCARHSPGKFSDPICNKNWFYSESPSKLKNTKAHSGLVTLAANNHLSVKSLSRCYLLLIEQCAFINTMYGTRILLNSLSLLIDMIRFTNIAVRLIIGSQPTLYASGYYPAAANMVRMVACASVVGTLVGQCERAYRQRDTALAVIDHTLVSKDPVKYKMAMKNLQLLQPLSHDMLYHHRQAPMQDLASALSKKIYKSAEALAGTKIGKEVKSRKAYSAGEPFAGTGLVKGTSSLKLSGTWGGDDDSVQAPSKKDSALESDKEEVPSISFFTLYRFATATDKLFIFLAVMCSILSGCTMPINTLLFASLLQNMVDYGMSVMQDAPKDDTFLAAIRDFAIYNSIVGVVVVILSYAATVLMNIAAYNQVYKMRQEYLKAALNQDFQYFDTHQTGGFATKMSDDVVKVEDGIGEKLGNFIFFQASFFSSIIMALIKGWKLALLCLISFPVTMLLVGIAGLVASRLSKKEAKASGKAGSIAEEVISTVRTVYAFSGQQKEIKRYQEHLEEVRKINIKKDPEEHYNVETMITVFFGVLMGSANFGISSTLMEVFGMARGAGAQIFFVIDNVPTINPLLDHGVTPPSIDGNIELKNVFFHYPSRPDVAVLKGVDLSVKRGQSVALVGHSGCGKSTIIQLISRYYDVIDGSVRVDGHDVRELSVRWLRAQVGLVGQEPVLFNTTVRENIRFGREDASDADIEAAAKQANAHQFILKLPKGYDTLVGERGAAMSGGQKQRIAIARALVRNPSILLLDEATSALDTSSESKVQKALDKAQEGRTTIVVAHRLSTIRNVDVIYVFKSGLVVETGNHDELMRKKGHYYDMVMLQTLPAAKESDGKLKSTQDVSVKSEKDEDDFIPMNTETSDSKDEASDISFWQVLKLNKPEWKSITIANLCSLISGFALPMLGVLLGDFVGVLSYPDPDAVLAEIRKFALIFVGIGIFSGFTNFTQVFFYAVAGEHLTERLRRLLFGKLLEQEIAFYDDKDNSTGAICARLAGEAASVQGATGQRIGTVLSAIGTFGFALVLSLIYEWRVGLVALVFVPIMITVMFKEGRMINAQSVVVSKTMEASSKIAVEAVANVRTVASLGREEQFVKEYSVKLQPGLALAKKATHYRGIVFGLSRGFFSFIYAVAMYYGGALIVYDHVAYDAVVKSAQALLMGAASAAQAFAFAPNFQKGIMSASRIIVLLNRVSEVKDPDEPAVKDFRGTGASSLQGVFFKYPTRPISVLNDLNLEVEKGKTVALVGASGCGKTTVIQLLERYYDPDDGIVAQDGVPLPNIRLDQARRTIGFVQQEPILFDRTIGENIAYGDNSRKPSQDEVEAAAKQANIHDFIASLPLGYDTNIGSKGTQLSGGQKQRVAIARALIRRPQMLLLDEATSALDTESEKVLKVVQAALDLAKAGRTCVMIAHRLSTVHDADVICVVHGGRVAERGTHQELMDLRKLYYNLNLNIHNEQ